MLPAAWLDRAGIRDEAVLVETEAGILVASPSAGTSSIEQDPSFAAFMNFLSQDVLHRPERLGDVGELFAGDDDLLEGVDPDAN